MCGIAGFLEPATGRQAEDARTIILGMMDAIVHRGPDDAGIWHDPVTGITLGHRRLSIVDLSPAGRQPMESPSGRFLIVFNGEIYNHRELRRKLADTGVEPVWRGHSDTETLVACFDVWGIEETIRHAVGMFAFGVWDRHDRRLILGRDRLGEKPLYYGCQHGVFLFGSQLKALQGHPAFVGEIDRGAIALLLRYNNVPAPASIYHDIHKLPPGCLLTVAWDALGANGVKAVPKAYWRLADVVEQGMNDPVPTRDPEGVIDQLDRLLGDAVARQMLADVPLGAFLSGGIDSSTVVALMQSRSGCPVRTFSIGFDEAGYNEADHARAVARHLGTEHTDLYVTPDMALEVIPRLPDLYDEPFADSSQIPTFLLARLTRRHVTVSLSGDGGDELFGGYNRYRVAPSIWNRFGKWPVPMRRALASVLQSVPPSVCDGWMNRIGRWLPRKTRFAQPADKIFKLSTILSAATPAEVYLGLVSHWHAAHLVAGAREDPSISWCRSDGVMDPSGFVQKMMAWDLAGYLPDDILVKLDRAAMGVSLETRVPFLDHRVVEFAWRIPVSMKINQGQGKWILRQVLRRYLPDTLIERPKMGFGVPIDSWLRGPMRDWAESLLDPARLRHEGYLEPGPIRQKWREHLEGKRNWQHQLWIVLMFQSWLERNRH